jgi:hypothetical protein
MTSVANAGSECNKNSTLKRIQILNMANASVTAGSSSSQMKVYRKTVFCHADVNFYEY